MNTCCCRNNHQPVDGFIYTDPGCHIHGLFNFTPTEAAMQEEKRADERAERQQAKKKQALADQRAARKLKLVTTRDA